MLLSCHIISQLYIFCAFKLSHHHHNLHLYFVYILYILYIVYCIFVKADNLQSQWKCLCLGILMFGWSARPATPICAQKYSTLSPRPCTLNQIMIMTKIIIMILMIMLIINNHDPNHHDFVESSCGPQPHQLRRHDILCGVVWRKPTPLPASRWQFLPFHSTLDTGCPPVWNDYYDRPD